MTERIMFRAKTPRAPRVSHASRSQPRAAACSLGSIGEGSFEPRREQRPRRQNQRHGVERTWGFTEVGTVPARVNPLVLRVLRDLRGSRSLGSGRRPGWVICGFSNSFMSGDFRHGPLESLSRKQDIAALQYSEAISPRVGSRLLRRCAPRNDIGRPIVSQAFRASF